MEFRKMRRWKQLQEIEICQKILKEEKRGVLSVIGENGYPYGVPINFFYDEEENCIYFHGAKEGHKIDAMKENNKVCFTTWNRGFQKPGDWAWNVTSVIAFGTVRFINEPEEMEKSLRSLGKRFYENPDELQREIDHGWNRVQMLRMDIQHMTGKLVNES